MTAARPSRRRLLLFRLILLGISLAFAALIGEIGLRILGHRGVAMLDMSDQIRAVDDEVVDYRYIPNSEHWTGDVVYSINDAGFRDDPHPVEKPAGTTRVAVIGDSVTYGFGVKQDQIFAAEAERRLGPDYELINVAMSGLNAPQVVHLLEAEGLRYDPDLVVMNFVLNDCDFFTRYRAALDFTREKDGEIGLLGISIDPRIKRAIKASALVYFLSQQAERLFGSEDMAHGDYVLSIWDDPANRALVADALDRFAALRAEHGFEPVILIWPVIAEFEGYAYQEIHDWVAAQARARDLDVIDLLPAFAEEAPHDDYYLSPNDYFHPNAKGHAVGARVFEDWVAARAKAG